MKRIFKFFCKIIKQPAPPLFKCSCKAKEICIVATTLTQAANKFLDDITVTQKHCFCGKVWYEVGDKIDDTEETLHFGNVAGGFKVLDCINFLMGRSDALEESCMAMNVILSNRM